MTLMKVSTLAMIIAVCGLLHRSIQDSLTLKVQEINAMRANYTLLCHCTKTTMQKCQLGIDKSELDPEKGFLVIQYCIGRSMLGFLKQNLLSEKSIKSQDFLQIQLGINLSDPPDEPMNCKSFDDLLAPIVSDDDS